MAKLRKMLCKIDDPMVIKLMKLIETQSNQTLANWSIQYAEKYYLSIYEQYQEADQLKNILIKMHQYLDGELSLKEAKEYVKESRLLASSLKHPTAQAAARSISTACSTITTPTSALGFTFYGCAAISYHTLGLDKTNEEYDLCADQEMERIYASLEAVAIKDEPNPAKIKWGC